MRNRWVKRQGRGRQGRRRRRDRRRRGLRRRGRGSLRRGRRNLRWRGRRSLRWRRGRRRQGRKTFRLDWGGRTIGSSFPKVWLSSTVFFKRAKRYRTTTGLAACDVVTISTSFFCAGSPT